MSEQGLQLFSPFCLFMNAVVGHYDNIWWRLFQNRWCNFFIFRDRIFCHGALSNVLTEAKEPLERLDKGRARSQLFLQDAVNGRTITEDGRADYRREAF